MTRKDIDELFKKRLLRKIPFNQEKIISSINIASVKLDEAKRLFSSHFLSNAILSAYTSMFHASRALLYKECIQEKSHYAVYIYLQEKFSNKISKQLLNSYNNYQVIRHDILYGFENDMDKDDSENAILDAEEFLMEVKKIIGL